LLALAIVSGLCMGGMYGLLALGFHITYAVSNTVNFAQGTSLMLGAVLCYSFSVTLGWPIGLAIVAAVFAVDRLRDWRTNGAMAGAVAALLLWLIASVGLSHPDYLAYFNASAGSEPEKILVDSDLDWLQDIKRLAKRLREVGAQEVAFLPPSFGPVERDIARVFLGNMGFPPVRDLDPLV